MHNDESSSAGGESPRLDREILDSLAMLGERQGKDLLGQLFGIFSSQGPIGFANLRQALADGDSKALREIAHSPKGSYRSLGIPRLADLAERLETQGREETWEGCAESIDALEKEFEATSEALGQWIEGRAQKAGSSP
jgi:HPt (histidine-containing phosphotransfer) domain-containing protein